MGFLNILLGLLRKAEFLLWVFNIKTNMQVDFVLLGSIWSLLITMFLRKKKKNLRDWADRNDFFLKE
jgi:hypothetical protein